MPSSSSGCLNLEEENCFREKVAVGALDIVRSEEVAAEVAQSLQEKKNRKATEAQSSELWPHEVLAERNYS